MAKIDIIGIVGALEYDLKRVLEEVAEDAGAPNPDRSSLLREFKRQVERKMNRWVKIADRYVKGDEEY